MMNVKKSLGVFLPSLAILSIGSVATAHAEDGMTLAVDVTPKLYFFDFTKGWADGDADNHFFRQYNYLESTGGSEDNGFIVDADVDLMLSDDKRVIRLQREGFGGHNHRNKATLDDPRIGGEAHYSQFTSSPLGLDTMAGGLVVESCDALGNCTFLPFTSLDDTAAGTAYIPRRVPNHVERTNRGASLTFKPAFFADWLSAKVSFDGYDRSGHQFLHFASTHEGIPVDTLVYRASASNFIIDETADTLSVGLASSLKGLFDIAYDFSVEKFINRSSDDNPRPTTGPVGSWQFTDTISLHYIPDTTLHTHAVRLNRQFGDRFALAGGYSRSFLDQDSNFQSDAGTTLALPTGGIQTGNAYLTGEYKVFDNLSVEAHAKRSVRDNTLNFVSTQAVIEEVDTREYGASGTFRTSFWNSTATLGWNHFWRQRDFVEIDPSAGILYRDETRNNELYLKLAARPLKGLSLQLIPSFVDALDDPNVMVFEGTPDGTLPPEYRDSSKVAYPTDPETAFNLKARVNYTAANGMALGAYYDRKRSRNSELTMNATSDNIDFAAQVVNQHVERTLQSAGATFAYMPTEKLNTSAHLYWTQTDAENYYLASTPSYRHFEWLEDGVLHVGLFDILGQQIDVYGVSLAADWKQSEKLTLRGNYSYTRAEGDIAESLMRGDVDPGTKIDHGIHALTLGADYAFTESALLKSYYTYEYYNDDSYPDLSGGLHTVMVGVSLKF